MTRFSLALEEIAYARSRLTMINFEENSQGGGNLWKIKSSESDVNVYMYIGPDNPTNPPSLMDLYGSAWTKNN